VDAAHGRSFREPRRNAAIACPPATPRRHSAPARSTRRRERFPTIAAARLETFGVKQVLLWGAVAECAIFAANKTAWNGWTEEQRNFARESAMQAAQELPALVQAENDAACTS
jgi:hypothetical protein